MNKFDVEFYEAPDGAEPVAEFLLSMDVKMRAKLLHLIGLLADNGNELREPYSKHLTDGIFELRARSGSDITRVLYFFYIGRKVILIHGFIKKTQKTPQKEIKKAKAFRADYWQRYRSVDHGDEI